MANEIGAIVGALAVAIGLILGILIVGAVVNVADEPADWVYQEYDAAELEGTNTFVAFDDGQGRNETVWKTTGFAVNLTGADDSYVEARDNVELASDDTWTVSTWAYVDQGAESDNMTAVSADGRVLIQYLDGNWSAWYYDEGARTSWRANVSASDQPTNYTLVTATSNGTHFWIYANTTKGDVVDVTGSSIEDATLNTTNWDGRLEETRTFDDRTNDTQQATLHANPVAARNDRNRTARIMYDQPGRAQIVIFQDTVADVSNGTFSAGFAAQEMDSDSVIGGDYEWSRDGPSIRPVSGGELDGFPVAYASYELKSNVMTDVVKGIGDAFNFASVIPILIVAALILGLVSKFG